MAPPPRPQLVVRKKPIWARRWVWAVAGLLVIAVIGGAIALNIRTNNRKELKAREIAAVRLFSSQIQSSVPTDSQALGDGFVLFATLRTDLNDLSSGKLKPDAATKKGTTISKQAETSADAIDKIAVSSIVPADARVSDVAGTEGVGATRRELLDAQYLMVQGLRLYADLGGLLKTAADLTGEERKALVPRLRDLEARANSAWARGYQKMNSIMRVLNIASPSQSQLPTIPGG